MFVNKNIDKNQQINICINNFLVLLQFYKATGIS